MMKFLNIVKKYGLWTVPIILLGGAHLLMKLHPYVSLRKEEILLLIGVSACSCFLIWNKNDMRIKNGKSINDIGFLDIFSKNIEAYDVNDEKKNFQYPEIDNRMLFKHPADTKFLLGKSKVQGKLKWVGISENSTNNHILLVGGSGSGKSSCQIITNLLLREERSKKDMKINYLVFDPKGELYEKTGKSEDIVFSPCDRTAYGYNPLYSLNESSSEQEIYEVASMITNSVIPLTSAKNQDNGPWNSLARDMLIGIIIFCVKYKKYTYLPQIINYLVSNQIEFVIEEACKESDENSRVRSFLQNFIGMSPETLYSVTANLFPKIRKFATDADLVYAMSANPKKFEMPDLLNKTIYINIPLNKIGQYACLLFLFIDQFAAWVYSLPEKKSESDRANITLLIDETTAIFETMGAIPMEFKNLLRYSRSFGVSVIFSLQSISGLKILLDEDSVNDVLSNVAYKIYLDSTSETKRLINDVGTYKSRRTTFDKDGKKSVSFEEEDILTQKEAFSLGQSDELICVSCFGYFRFKKVSYYKEKLFKEMIEK